MMKSISDVGRVIHLHMQHHLALSQFCCVLNSSSQVDAVKSCEQRLYSHSADVFDEILIAGKSVQTKLAKNVFHKYWQPDNRYKVPVAMQIVGLDTVWEDRSNGRAGLGNVT